MRTSIISSSFHGFVIAVGSLAIMSYPVVAATNCCASPAGGVTIVTGTNSDSYQFDLGGDHAVTTVYSSTGRVTTTNNPDAVAVPASQLALYGVKIPTPMQPEPRSIAPHSSATAGDDAQPFDPHPKSKFRKLIFAAAVVPIAAIGLLFRGRRAEFPRPARTQVAIEPRSNPIVGIAMGRIDSRSEKPIYPANHPWYA